MTLTEHARGELLIFVPSRRREVQELQRWLSQRSLHLTYAVIYTVINFDYYSTGMCATHDSVPLLMLVPSQL